MSDRHGITEAKAIRLHLSYSDNSRKARVISGFAKALRETRQATGRNPESGEKFEGQSQDSWLGAVGYMVLLDQIGICFKPRTVPTVDSNTIKKALRYFSILSDQEIDALYALRCAFAHDFSLCNINGKRPTLTHYFMIKNDSTGQVVTLPKKQWDGKFRMDDDFRWDDYTTIINLERFGDLVEDICIRLFQLANEDGLELILGPYELVQRYMFRF